MHHNRALSTQLESIKARTFQCVPVSSETAWDRTVGKPPPDFRRRTLPWLVSSASALICVVMLVNRAGKFEYIAMDPTMQPELADSGESEGPESFWRIQQPADDGWQVLATQAGPSATCEWTESRATNPSELVVDSDVKRLPTIESIEMERSGFGQLRAVSPGLDGLPQRMTVAGFRE